MLQSYASSAMEPSHSARERAVVSPGSLSPNINQWPIKWRNRYKTTAEKIGQLLPIESLFAEAAAEIAVRYEYLRQSNDETESRGSSSSTTVVPEGQE